MPAIIRAHVVYPITPPPEPPKPSRRKYTLTVPRRDVPRTWDKARVEQLLSLWDSCSVDFIAKAMNCTTYVIRRKAELLGLKRRKPKKYPT